MFLLGGTAFSGKTLLAHLLNQGDVVCLDEPDFHNPAQSHRGIPLLNALFPAKTFPPQPEHALSFQEAVTFIEQCEAAIRPIDLGMKTAGWTFLQYAPLYRRSEYPIIAVIRDIRDVIAEAPLPEWIQSEHDLCSAFIAIWTNRGICDLLIRYEDLVTEPASVIENISVLLGRSLDPMLDWSASSVHSTMFKLERHDMLREGKVSQDQVGIWRRSKIEFSDEIHATAAIMGYGR